MIILLGAPNSGKSTLARKISDKYSIPQISTGDILRNEVKNGSLLGNMAQYFLSAGGLMPDEIIINMLKFRLSMSDCSKGYILDGFPRTIQQAQKLEEMLKQDKNVDVKVVNLDVDKDVLYERLSKRYICPDCFKSYLLDNFEPEKSKCECGGILTKRPDDTTEILAKRLSNYEAYKRPILAFYADRRLNFAIHNAKRHSKVLDNIINLIA